VRESVLQQAVTTWRANHHPGGIGACPLGRSHSAPPVLPVAGRWAAAGAPAGGGGRGTMPASSGQVALRELLTALAEDGSCPAAAAAAATAVRARAAVVPTRSAACEALASHMRSLHAKLEAAAEAAAAAAPAPAAAPLRRPRRPAPAAAPAAVAVAAAAGGCALEAPEAAAAAAAAAAAVRDALRLSSALSPAEMWALLATNLVSSASARAPSLPRPGRHRSPQALGGSGGHAARAAAHAPGGSRAPGPPSAPLDARRPTPLLP
jgi:hypothetical protein